MQMKQLKKLWTLAVPTAAAAQGAPATDDNKEMHTLNPKSKKKKEQLELDPKGGGDKKEFWPLPEERFEMLYGKRSCTRRITPITPQPHCVKKQSVELEVH